MSGPGKFKFDALVEHDCIVRGWSWYDAPGVDGLVEFADHSGSLVIEDLQSKGIRQVPPRFAGQLKITSQKSRDVRMGWYAQNGLSLLAKWRPSMGTPDTIRNRVLFASYAQIASSAIEPDPDDPLLLVWRFTGSSSAMGSTAWGVRLLDEWQMNGAWPWVTAVIRYRIDKSPGDEALIARALTVGSGVSLVEAGSTASTSDGKWHTAAFSIRPNNQNFSFVAQRVGTQTGPITTRIAAFDLYLGLDWVEPVDLDIP